MTIIKIYTDGSCSGNPGPGGWAAILLYNNNEKILSGNEEKTTNNRMEIKAVIEGISALKNNTSKTVQVYSDSAYLVNCINFEWIKKWKQNDWSIITKKTKVLNVDLWKKLDSLLHNTIHTIKFIKIKSHNGNALNEKADKIAKKETELAKNNLMDI